MRTIEYLSPSALGVYLHSPEKYYQQYLSENRLGRDPQTQPMSVGSAFDAYIKSYMHQKLFGNKDEAYDLRRLFEAQVEQQWWEWAWIHGKHCFEQYKQTGCLADLMLMLETSVSEPRFEFEIKGVVSGYREGVIGQFGEVVILGRPDVDFVTSGGVHVILDFKVNGYCKVRGETPKQYYVKMRSAGRTNYGTHGKCQLENYNGVIVNTACFLEDIDAYWARQLASYGWLLGEQIGTPFITMIHQLVCAPNTTGFPLIRVAEHVNRVGPVFQQKVFDQYIDLWDRVHSGHFFREMTPEDSHNLCQLLDDRIDPQYEYLLNLDRM
jgi:hypothetical protein